MMSCMTRTKAVWTLNGLGFVFLGWEILAVSLGVDSLIPTILAIFFFVASFIVSIVGAWRSLR